MCYTVIIIKKGGEKKPDKAAEIQEMWLNKSTCHLCNDSSPIRLTLPGII